MCAEALSAGLPRQPSWLALIAPPFRVEAILGLARRSSALALSLPCTICCILESRGTPTSTSSLSPYSLTAVQPHPPTLLSYLFRGSLQELFSPIIKYDEVLRSTDTPYLDCCIVSRLLCVLLPGGERPRLENTGLHIPYRYGVTR